MSEKDGFSDILNLAEAQQGSRDKASSAEDRSALALEHIAENLLILASEVRKTRA